MSGAPDEFDLIAQLFAPLSASYPGAFNLTDDAALMDVPPGRQVVLTMDAMVAGVHFFADDPADLIARKLVRVNLSDLAAKGAVPFAVMLAAAFPQGIEAEWLRAFADGLGQDVAEFSIALIGGDTVSTPGPLTLSLTAFGHVPTGRALLRSGARAGDLIWLSGSLGDSALGLRARQGQLTDLNPLHRDFLIHRYLLPQPRVALGPALIGVASAGMDISDGLVQDLGHLARQSGLAAEIRLADLPLSVAARTATENNNSWLACILGGGDDYEIAFTADPAQTQRIRQLADDSGVALSAIGQMTAGQGVAVMDRQGKAMEVAQRGWRHFSNAGEQP
ncbi:thiamine-phosphate kinase [Magnetospirillum sulfuroxidans]|uniref:Thiamine-monophosphate kinase n=1 Tax=Magnetospirillum sulfuroxidans TaxID=611300 RepID=A0ABS5I833_9PROT|nr:thiamine-phosphate kinase [Magnetospirillum sulfuroxidans]